MRLITLLLSILLISNASFAQQQYATKSKKAIKFYQEAMSAFNLMDFALVETKLNDAIEKDPLFIDAYLLRSELYRINLDYHKQISDLQTQ